MPLKDHYPDAYGRYKKKPDLSKCCERVTGPSPWEGSRQCSKPNGHGPDGAYCKTHDPAAVEARRQASEAKYNESRKKWALERNAEKLALALDAIERGHNDPREVAKEALADLRRAGWTP